MNTKGIIEQARAATTTEEIKTLVDKVKTYKYISPVTLRKFNRIVKTK